MILTKRTIAATFAALLIAGFAISPVSAAVSRNSGTVDINDVVRILELRKPDITDAPFHPDDWVAPQDDVQLAQQRQTEPEV